MIKSKQMKFHRAVFFLPFFFMVACGSPGTGRPTEDSLEVLALKVRAREEEVRRFKQKLETSGAHSHFKEEADLEAIEERLTTVRLKLDVLRTSDSAAQPKARDDFNSALSELSLFLRDVESRYGTEAK